MGYAYSRKTKNGKSVWYVGFRDEGGRDTRQATRCRTKTEARKVADDLERKAERVRLGLEVGGRASAITLNLLAAEYLAGPAKSRRSFDDIRRRIQLHVLPHLGSTYLHHITPADLEALAALKAAEGLSPQTCLHIINHVSAMFTWAIKKKRCFSGQNPAAICDKPKVIQRTPRTIPSNWVSRIIEASEDSERDLFATAIYTGARKHELAAIEVQHVSLETGVLLLLSRKTSKWRPVPIHPELVPYLRRAMSGKAGQDLLFLSRSGRPISKGVKLSDLLRSAVRDAGFEGLDVSFKDLRSTFATLAYESTGDIRYVQRMLGHSDPRVTERAYAAMRDARMTEQMAKLKFGTAA